MSKEIKKIDPLKDYNWITCNECDGAGHIAAPTRTAPERTKVCAVCWGYKQLPENMPAVDAFGRDVKVGDKVVAAPHSRYNAKPRMCLVTEVRYEIPRVYRYQQGYIPQPHRVRVGFKLKGLPALRASSGIVKMDSFSCDVCGEEKHRHQVIVLCGDHGKKVKKDDPRRIR